MDLVSPMLELALGSRPAIQPLGAPGVSTHQLLLAVLGAAQKTGERRVVYRELVDSLRHTGDYDGSWEELTPLHGDWRAALPVAIATSLSLIYPPLEKLLSSGAVRNYALSPHGWQQLLDYCR